jgi:hypothetical protein
MRGRKRNEDNVDAKAIEVVGKDRAVELAAPWTDAKIAIRTSMNPEDTIRLKNSSGRLEDQGDKPFKVADVIQHIVQMPDKDGVLQACVRTILVDDKGNGYASISEGIYSGVFDLMFLRGGPPPFDPPIPVRLDIIRTGKGRRMYKLLPA